MAITWFKVMVQLININQNKISLTDIFTDIEIQYWCGNR